MLGPWLLASLHLLGLGIGLGAIVLRAAALRGTLDAAGLRRVFRTDALWGIAALLWLVTGLVRAFAGVEKPADYYLQAPLFHAKLGLFVLVFLLELQPMITLMRWRMRVRSGQPVNAAPAARFARISEVQAVLVVVILFLATALARGYGM